MRDLRFLLLASAALALAGSPAAAQWYGGPPGPYLYNTPAPPYGSRGPASDRPLPRSVIMDRLEAQGFDEVGRPRFEGEVYVVEAISPAGQPVRLVVDAFDARILRRVALGAPRLDDLDDDDTDPPPRNPRSAGRGGFGLPDEMPNAPRYRPGEPDASDTPLRREAGRPVEPIAPVETAPLGPPTQLGRPAEPRREAGRPAEPAAPAEAGPLGPPTQLGRPADPRLAPSESRNAPPAEPDGAQRREASRPSAAPPRTAPPAPSGVYGLNPGASARPATPDPKPRQAVAPTRPRDQGAEPSTASPSPSAPAPTVAAPKPDSATATTEAANRRPVRVIPGVTPMDGGQQSSPPPQNNMDAPKLRPSP